MANIDLYTIYLDGDTGGGGKPAILESLSVSENGVYVPSEGVDGYNQVNVNVTTPTEVFVVPDGVKFAYSSFTEIPDYFDFSNVTSMSFMFSYCTRLTVVNGINSSRVYKMYEMFRGCTRLTTIVELITSGVQDVDTMFYGCSSLQSIALLDFSRVISISNFFGLSDITTLTDLGGFKNLKIDWKDDYGLNRLPNLTYQSVMNVINNLYDFRGNGDTSTTRTIQFNAKSKALLSESDIAIATAKGWVIS